MEERQAYGVVVGVNSGVCDPKEERGGVSAVGGSEDLEYEVSRRDGSGVVHHVDSVGTERLKVLVLVGVEI